MMWKIISAWTDAPLTPVTFKPEPQVYRKHVEILRRIKAPEKLIKLAEEVADANSAPVIKAETR